MNAKREQFITQQPISAAAYLRMSTEDQKYSIDSQRAVIAEYAAANGLNIVQHFEDSGVSGLDLKHRPGLQALLRIVVSPGCPFTTVLTSAEARRNQCLQSANDAAAIRSRR